MRYLLFLLLFPFSLFGQVKDSLNKINIEFPGVDLIDLRDSVTIDLHKLDAKRDTIQGVVVYIPDLSSPELKVKEGFRTYKYYFDYFSGMTIYVEDQYFIVEEAHRITHDDSGNINIYYDFFTTDVTSNLIKFIPYASSK